MPRLFDLLGSALSSLGWRRRWLKALGAIGLAVTLVAVAWNVFLPDIQIRLDPSQVLYGIAAVIIAWGFYLLVERRPSAASTVVVNYDFKLTQPTLPNGRYRFELEVFYERDVKGRHERQRQSLIELTFKKHEHPDIWGFCEREIGRLLKDHRKLAGERFPHSTILSAPPPRSRRRTRRPAAHPETPA